MSATDRIGKGPLHEVCVQIADTALTTNTKPDGTSLARLIKRLIAAETTPGGPYQNASGEPDLLTNVAIAYLFASLHIPLPKVTAFIKTHRAGKQDKEVAALLKKYDAALRSQQPSFQTAPIPLFDTIFSTVAAQFAQFEEPLRSLSLQFLQRIRHADKHFEIPLFASYFSDTLTTSSNPPLALLGEANIYCWMAYTIYDHLLDGQSDTEALPVANCAHRLALAKYFSLFPPHHPFSKLVTSTFNNMDTANSWEVANCQFTRKGSSIIIPSLPRYSQFSILAHRSFGHALGPMALTYLCDMPSHSRRLIEKGLRHYLIARQLTDDICDWQEDIRKGSGSAIVTYILRHARVRPGMHEIDPLINRMQEDFWQHSMEAANALIKNHIQLSRDNFMKSNSLLPHGPLFDLLERLDTTASQSTRTHTNYKEFISTYRESL